MMIHINLKNTLAGDGKKCDKAVVQPVGPPPTFGEDCLAIWQNWLTGTREAGWPWKKGWRLKHTAVKFEYGSTKQPLTLYVTMQDFKDLRRALYRKPENHKAWTK